MIKKALWIKDCNIDLYFTNIQYTQLGDTFMQSDLCITIKFEHN